MDIERELTYWFLRMPVSVRIKLAIDNDIWPKNLKEWHTLMDVSKKIIAESIRIGRAESFLYTIIYYIKL